MAALSLKLHTAPSSSAPTILGSPWLALHNPQINWSAPALTGWSVACHLCCLRSALPPAPLSSCSAPVTIPLSAVPEVYHDIEEAFSKQPALSLSPHCPYDWAIELSAGVPLPSSWLYKPEREAMEKYISESLVAGLVRPSTSPVSAGFFFCEEGWHSPILHWPCIGV